MLERLFGLRAAGTTVRTELGAGLVTFMTMSYILFVQPAVLSRDFAGQPTGLSAEAILLATCLSSCLGSLVMALWANYPIALAPGMGENFFFVSVIMALGAAGMAEPWRAAMGVVFLSGVLFLLLSLCRVREAILDALPPSLKNGIAVGIGLFIALIGLRNAGLIVPSPGTLVRLSPDLHSPGVLIFLCGFLLTCTLLVRRVRGAVLWGILGATVVSLVAGEVHYRGLIGPPRDHAFFGFDLRAALRPECLPYIVIFLFMNVFDTVGTLVGVGEQGGFIRGNRLPRATQALAADAVGTMAGACMGTSTVTAYVESVVGVEHGGRTGLTSLTVAGLFLLALLFNPLVAMVGESPPITAPALVVVGAMMIRNALKIDWGDYAESVPAFLILMGIPFTFSIADGLALGFIAYPAIKLLSGRGREVSPLLYLVAGMFILRYLLFPA